MNRHEELKTSLMLFESTLTHFAARLTRPDGTRGVSRTAVTRVAQGHEEIDWIDTEIDRAIQKAKAAFPEFWKKKQQQASETK